MDSKGDNREFYYGKHTLLEILDDSLVEELALNQVILEFNLFTL